MALAEIMVKIIDGDTGKLDYDEDWAADDNKFKDLSSFTADKESVKWLRDYLSDSLKNNMEYAVNRAQHGTQESDKWGGWVTEEKWHRWQDHMKSLVSRLDRLLASPEDQIELIRPQEQTQGPVMGQSLQ